MNSQDMSIYWNQRKGQYETDNFYQEIQHPFTITADSRLKYKEEVLEEEEEEKVSEEGVSIASWFGILMMMLIPGVNVIGTLIMAFASKNENKKAFARAVVLVTLICMTVILVFMAITCDSINYRTIIDKIFDLSKVVLLKVKSLI